MRAKNGKLPRSYRKWSSMRQRCENPKHLAFPHYGAKGVKVCERWRSYDAFLEDMGEPPDGFWLDRIDNSKGYEPGNCRWVTPKESALNRKQRGPNRDPNSLRFKAESVGLKYQTVYQRIHWGWTEERALSEPVQTRSFIQRSLELEHPERFRPMRRKKSSSKFGSRLDT